MTPDHNTVKAMWEQRDRVTRAMSEDGLFRVAVIQNTAVTRTAQQRHELDPVRAVLLARALTSASLLASFMKGEERVSIMVDGSGVVKHLYAEALHVGEVRGYATVNRQPADPSAPLGAGILKVQRVLYGKQEPVTGVVELRQGDVTSDMGYYLTQSEQIPSVVVIDVTFNNQNEIVQSAGLLVQAMPGARPEDIFQMYDALDAMPRLTSLFDKPMSTEAVIDEVCPIPMTILETKAVDFFCRCSLDRFKSILLTLGYSELKSMRDADQGELVCQYCNEQYKLTAADFDELLEQSLARQN